MTKESTTCTQMLKRNMHIEWWPVGLAFPQIEDTPVYQMNLFGAQHSKVNILCFVDWLTVIAGLRRRIVKGSGAEIGVNPAIRLLRDIHHRRTQQPLDSHR